MEKLGNAQAQQGLNQALIRPMLRGCTLNDIYQNLIMHNIFFL